MKKNLEVASKKLEQLKPEIFAPKKDKERRYIDKDTFKGGKLAIYSCDMVTGLLVKVSPKKQMMKNSATGVIVSRFYIEPVPKKLYLTAENIEKAKTLFESQFNKMAEEIELENSYRIEKRKNKLISMNRCDIATEVARKVGITKAQAGGAVDAVIDTIREGVYRGDSMVLKSFGTFKKRDSAERVARNPKTGEKVIVPACVKVSFKASKDFLKQD